MTDPSISEFAEFAGELADIARGETMPRFGSGEAPANKNVSGEFDPVTEADKAAEAAMRAEIGRRYPDHGIEGEEEVRKRGSGPYCWSLDPIDGTRSFICGLPSWTTLIALLRDGQPILGLIDAPRLGEIYLGWGEQTLLNGHPVRTSHCRSLGEARLSTTDPYLFAAEDYEGFTHVRRAVRTARYGHDAYAYARLAAGQVDLVVEAGLKPHDYNALLPVIRGAGGTVGDWRGNPDCTGGRLIAAATLRLYEETVALLGG